MTEELAEEQASIFGRIRTRQETDRKTHRQAYKKTQACILSLKDTEMQWNTLLMSRNGRHYSSHCTIDFLIVRPIDQTNHNHIVIRSHTPNAKTPRNHSRFTMNSDNKPTHSITSLFITFTLTPGAVVVAIANWFGATEERCARRALDLTQSNNDWGV